MIQLSNDDRIAQLATNRTDEELKNFLYYLDEITLLRQNQHKFSSQETNTMFQIYRDYWGKLEYNTHCSSCRNRVFDELQYCKTTIQTELNKRNG